MLIVYCIMEDPRSEFTVKSKLGCKDYWEELYAKEREVFGTNGELIGEVWFGETVQAKVLGYMSKEFSAESRVVDIGCGNSAFLICLHEAGFSRLAGIDYSESSIEFSREILLKKGIKQVELKRVDIARDPKEYALGRFDVIHDKGTFDAFMLSTENSSESYMRFVQGLTGDKGSDFVITSCNFTKGDLLKYFASFELVAEIPHRKFSFGGNEGQAVTSLHFKVLK